ncbi:MAG: 2-oxo acid dehydrogenase subunit E2 [Phycisphaerae bacterium]|nr:2-oxo acid dehydrogenase subunit E2 [Phycisphaerae bacterium]
MGKEFKLPDLGEGIHEAQVVNVMIKEGDTVAADQMVMEVETDKAAVELPVPFAGVINKLNVKQGDTVKVGQVLLEVGGAGETSADKPAAKSAEAPAPKAASAPAAGVAKALMSQTVGGEGRSAPVHASTTAAPPAHAEGPIPAAPAVRKFARENGIDLRAVHGTGPAGRIVREDVERYMLAGPMGTGAPPAPARTAPTAQPVTPARGDAVPSVAAPSVGFEPLPDFSQWGPVRREKVAQIRKTIARQMQRAWTLPRVTHGDEADVTDLESFRKEHGSVMAEQGVKLTITAFMLKAVAGALRQYPSFNASYDDAAGEMIFKDYVHIGIAVDSPKGLMVPVLRDADRKGLMTISKEMKEIAEKARDFKLAIDDMRGGTFTVTNVGALGGTFATPMINYPEVAILGMGKLQEKPVVRDGQIVIRKMLPLFLSFDHRVIDGADAARFCRTIINFLENPLNLLLAS